MKNCNCNDKNSISTQYLRDLPWDVLESLPTAFLAERDVEDPVTGEVKATLTRIPSGKLFPAANTDNVFALTPNNDTLEIPERQVRAGTIVNLVSSTQVQYASDEDPALFIMIGKLAGMVLCQNVGVVNCPAGHDYIIKQQYYTGENGEPVTDATSGQKLFIPISRTQLLLNMD